jgi:hypothetical protein
VHRENAIGQNAGSGQFCRCGAWRGDLGLEPTLDLYLDHMVEIMREVRRVMRKDATCWLNIGDSYNNVRSQMGPGQAVHGRDELRGKPAPNDRKRGTVGFKEKDLMLIPWRLAIRLQDDGWFVRSAICWAKRAPMPESCTDRPTCAWEPVFQLTKSGSPQFWTHRDHAGSRIKTEPDYRWVDHDNDDAETDVEPADWRTAMAATKHTQAIPYGWAWGVPGSHDGIPEGSYQHGKRKRWSRINLWQAHDYFYDNEAVKEEAVNDHDSGNGFDRPARLSMGQGDPTPWVRNGSGKRNLRNVWHLGPEPFPEAHFATFVSEIPRICIKAGTSERGVCPKCGAPWCRVVKETMVRIREGSDTSGDAAAVAAKGRHGSSSIFTTGEKPIAETIGWQPSCSCDAAIKGYSCGDCSGRVEDPCRCRPDLKPVSATCLDPFFGAGTTGLVADQLQRDCIGIELNADYAKMAQGRITAGNSLFSNIAVDP